MGTPPAGQAPVSGSGKSIWNTSAASSSQLADAIQPAPGEIAGTVFVEWRHILRDSAE
jgi:hypothetical protein